MTVRLLASLSLAAIAYPLSAVESFDRRSRSEPEIAVQDGGRSGACDAVRFSPDGKFLFAAGDDKVVTVWPHAATGLDTDQTRLLRWPAWREQRGGIKDVAVSPDGKRVLVGGYGLRVATVAVLEVEPPKDGGMPKMELTWPKTRPGQDSFRTVQAVAFGPDGQTVAFATEDGSVWLWKPERRKAADEVDRWYNTPLWVGRHAKFDKPADDKHWKEVETPHSRRLFFRKPHELVSVNRTGEVWRFDVSEPGKLTDVRDRVAAPAQRLFALGDGKAKFDLFYAAYDPTTDLLAVAPDRSPRVIVRPFEAAKPAVELKLPDKHFASTVAVSKDGAVAVAVGTAVPALPGGRRFHNDADNEVWVYRKPAADSKPDVVLKVHGQAEAVAFHPTADRLAVGGGDADEVTLYDLAKPTVPLTVARGSGRKPWALALSADGTALGLQTQRNAAVAEPNGRGTGDWAWLDLTVVRRLDNAPKNPVTALDTADGWTVEPDKDERDVWHASHPTVGKLKLDHDPRQFNKPTCYTFLKAADGRPTRLLVGHYYGASLYELPNKPWGGLLPRSRLYVGHAGEVLSVAAADDAKGGWFVTGGSDHTVAAYSLAAWDHHPTLGATFAKTPGGGIAVTDVAVGSPGWEAGLLKGDELVRLAVRGKPVYDVRGVAKAPKPPAQDTEKGTLEDPERGPTDKLLADPKEALAAFAAPQPGEELYFRVRSKTGERDAQTTVRQRPLWKLYPAFDESGRMVEWVVWVWKGSYHAGSVNGDRLVGWHLNGPTAKDAPRYHKLGDFPMYRKKEVVQRLLATRDLAAVLERTLGTNPLPPKFDGVEPAPIRLAVDRTEVTNRPVTVTVRVDRQRSDVDLLPERVELWVNDHRYQEWIADPTKVFNEPAVINPEAFRAADNTLTVRTYNRAGGSAERVSEPITNRNPPGEPTLLGLTVGVNDYKAHRDASDVI